MRTHPVFLCLEGRRCVIVGGDAAAATKAAACVQAGGCVTVIAPEVAPEVAVLAAAGRLQHLARLYRKGDLAGAFLAYASPSDPGTVRCLVAEARDERVLLNVIDTPDACTFISPAVVERGELQVAVGTGGASPGLAAQLRREIEVQLGAEYAPFVAILGAVRRTLGADPLRAGERAQVVATLLASPLLDLVRHGHRAEIDALLARVAGSGCTLERLGVALDGRGA
jgi:precorrin-2 dehydrogenase/sirohydrochlorin ferrochelatase